MNENDLSVVKPIVKGSILEHVCQCSCHQQGANKMHLGQCCEACPKCGEKIIYDLIMVHHYMCDPNIRSVEIEERGSNEVEVPLLMNVRSLVSHTIGQGFDDGP